VCLTIYFAGYFSGFSAVIIKWPMNQLVTDEVFFFSRDAWAEKSADLISSHFSSLIRSHGNVALVLTGGRGASKVYDEWCKKEAFYQSRGVDIYFTDERLLSEPLEESNFSTVTKVLFNSCVPKGVSVHKISRIGDAEVVAEQYEKIFPSRVDILLLTLGDDGHIASIFPGSPAVVESQKLFVPAHNPNNGGVRVTMTPAVLRRAESIFVLVPGIRKLNVLDKVFEDRSSYGEIPGRLIPAAKWLLCL